MVRWHHRLNGHKFKQTQGDSEGQGSLACCSPWGHKELDMTERLTEPKNESSRISRSLFPLLLTSYIIMVHVFQ